MRGSATEAVMAARGVHAAHAGMVHGTAHVSPAHMHVPATPVSPASMAASGFNKLSGRQYASRDNGEYK
jgi:hypothetical protein